MMSYVINNESITFNLPYKFGTFVKVLNEDKTVKFYGTVSSYTLHEDGWLVWISGYKTAITEECLPEEIEIMTDEEIKSIKGE